jgi:hypothetical protein
LGCNHVLSSSSFPLLFIASSGSFNKQDKHWQGAPLPAFFFYCHTTIVTAMLTMTSGPNMTKMRNFFS